MTTQTSISLESKIKDLICTSRPYYALRNLQLLTDKLFQAEIEVENFYFGELTPISAAETGRHLAILGSCALAYSNPVASKHYYLACEATLERSDAYQRFSSATIDKHSRLIARAEVVYQDNKTGKVVTSISTHDGITIFDLEVSYKIMKAELFQKLFRNKYRDNTKTDYSNPYTETISVSNLKFDGNNLTGEIGTITPAHCPGHFDGYPALPIAILSSAFVDVAGKHLKHITNNPFVRYAAKYCTLNASQLAFADEEVFLESTLKQKSAGLYTFEVKATSGLQQSFGSAEITFDIIPNTNAL